MAWQGPPKIHQLERSAPPTFGAALPRSGTPQIGAVPSAGGQKVRPWGGRFRILAAPSAGAYNSGDWARPVLSGAATDVRRLTNHPLDRRAEGRPPSRRPGAL